MPCVVADTSPLFYLAALGRLTLLRDIYRLVIAPQSVWDEAIAGRRSIPETSLLLEAARADGWLEIHPFDASVLQPPELASAELDRGERDALALAVALGADLVLIDELEGRAVADRLGLAVAGTVGILIEAKRIGLLPAVGPELIRLQDETTFWLSRSMERIALDMAGEAPESPPFQS